MRRKGLGIEEFCNPPQKVRQVFQAVIELLSQKEDIHTLKVADITKQAGIGKGTAYEYFSSREEIITLALLYDYGNKLKDLEHLMKKVPGFKDKILFLFDWLHDHKEYHMTFVHMMRISLGSADISASLKNQIPPEIYNGMVDYLLEHTDTLLEQGGQEGIFKQKDPVKRRMAFSSALVQLVLTFGKVHGQILCPLEYEKARLFAYDSLVRMLS